MVIEPQELNEPPTKKKEVKWENLKRELIFWTTLLANLITIFFFLYRLYKNGF